MAVSYPVGIQHFAEIIENKAVYVDKTDFIYELIRQGSPKPYFLSRPRRFGKSLLISTFQEIFSGNKDLFKGLYIYDKIEWQKFPIIHISFVNIGIDELTLTVALEKVLHQHAEKENLVLNSEGIGLLFQELIQKLHAKYQKGVVILIDEYDKPITLGLEKGDFDLAEKNRDIMKTFYSILKDSGNLIRLLFITGISKFAKVSIFSELNHLSDLTLDENFAAICGYTHQDLKDYFQEGIEKLAEKEGVSKEEITQKIEHWYDGFSWDGKTFVYNPFSFLQLMRKQQFANYWFETGTPTFLIKLLSKDQKYQVENLVVGENAFSTYNFRQLSYISLMLQTGYLTIKEKIKDEDNYYRINYPNHEVKVAFNEMLLSDYLNQPPNEATATLYYLKSAFEKDNIQEVIKIIDALFASIPSQLFSDIDKDGNEKVVAENFYHAVIYLAFNILSVKMQAEVIVRDGRVDAVVETKKCVYIFEFKKNRSAAAAIKQMQTKNYAQKYLLSGKEIFLIGINFTFKKRGIQSWKMLKVE